MIQRRLALGARNDEGQPREHEHDVRPEEVRGGVPARRQEQQQVERQATDCGPPGHEAEERQQSDRDLDDRDAYARDEGVGDRKGRQDESAGRAVGEADELGPDVGRCARVQESGVAQLLDARIDEGDAQEQPERKQRQAWLDCGRSGPHSGSIGRAFKAGITLA